MLFVFETLGRYPFWMWEVSFPLDIVWLDPDLTVVEMVFCAQPCPLRPCPRYGGIVPSAFALELAGGTVDQLGLRLGDRLGFQEGA
jgi:uncharacterized membrane protein (UPF0127 family)